MKENDKICMTVREASRYSGLGEHLLRRMIKAGKLPAFNVGPKSIIMRDTLVVFLHANTDRNLTDVENLNAIGKAQN